MSLLGKFLSTWWRITFFNVFEAVLWSFFMKLYIYKILSLILLTTFPPIWIKFHLCLFLRILIDIIENEPSKKSLVAAKKFYWTTSQGFFLSFWYFRTCAWNDVGQQRNFVLKPLKQPHTAFQKKITHKNKEKNIV